MGIRTICVGLVCFLAALLVAAGGCSAGGEKNGDRFVPFVPAAFGPRGGEIRELPGLMQDRQFRLGLALYLMGSQNEFMWTPESVLVRLSLADDVEYRANITSKAVSIGKSYHKSRKDPRWP